MAISTATDLRQQYLDFFTERGHTIIPSAALVPENDPTGPTTVRTQPVPSTRFARNRSVCCPSRQPIPKSP